MAEPASQGGLHHEWSGPASIRGPSAFQADALTGVKGRRPRPLDDGGSDLARAGTRYQRPLS